jgi:hypothetical protein
LLPQLPADIHPFINEDAEIQGALYMWIGRLAVVNAAAGFLSVAFVSVGSVDARAQTAELTECATQYQAAKADNKLAGQPWQDFYAACKAKLSAGAPAAKSEAPEAAAPVPAPEPKAEAEAPKSEAAPAAPAAPAAESAAPAPASKPDKAALEKKCRAQFKAEKKKDPKATWDKYWKQCGSKG